jgi:hypothetical protein
MPCHTWALLRIEGGAAAEPHGAMAPSMQSQRVCICMVVVPAAAEADLSAATLGMQGEGVHCLRGPRTGSGSHVAVAVPCSYGC